jgi:hypothetical protein
MIHRLVLTSGLMLAGAVAFSPKAFAQSVDVMFNGNIGPECSFAAPVPGTLVYSGDFTSRITSDAPGGVSGKVDVSCNTPGASVQISDARFVSFTPTNPQFDQPPFPPGGQYFQATARVPGAQTYYDGFSGSGSSSSMPLFPNGTSTLRQTVEVDLSVNEGNYQAGNYQYAVTLTITP